MGWFGQNKKKAVIKKFREMERTYQREQSLGNYKASVDVYKAEDGLITELWEACLEDKSMDHVIGLYRLNEKKFMEAYRKVQMTGILSVTAQAVAVSDPETLSYIMRETSHAELAVNLVKKHGTS